MAEARQRMNDYRYIRMQGAKYRKIRPEDTREVHRDHRAWLEAALATPFAGRTVVVTHHGPVPGVADGKTPGLEPTYTSDLTALIDRYRPDTWLFGHTHIPASLQQGQTKIANVSLGYPVHVADDEVAAMVQRALMAV